jgi:hypothetical protein
VAILSRRRKTRIAWLTPIRRLRITSSSENGLKTLGFGLCPRPKTKNQRPGF